MTDQIAPPATPTFSLRAEPDGRALRVCPIGELDVATVPQLEQALDRALAGGGSVVLDLSGLTFIDSRGIKLVLRALEVAERDRSRLVLVPGPHVVMRTFDLLDLTPLLAPHLRAA